MCDMAHDGDGATEASFTSDADGLIYVVLQMAVWVMDEVRCVELQTAVQHQYGGASSIFILEFKFPGDDDWMVVGMKSLTADYADGTVNSSYTFAPGQRQLQEDSGSRRELEVVRKLEAATAEASDGASSNRRHLHALVCPTGYYDSTNGNARGFLQMWASVCWGNSGCPGSGSWSRSDSDCGCACVENPPVTLCTDDCMVGGRFWTQSASNDGQCDDGGAGSDFSDCALGTDCVDCGSREFTACSNDCGWANDGVCDDGGPDAAFSCCALGSDCNDCGDRAVPSADDNSGNYWSTICKVVEAGACASDAECTGSRLCTRSTNPSDDYVCSGDSGCEQVRLASACPSAPPPTPSHPTPHTHPARPNGAAAACVRTGPRRQWSSRLTRRRRPRCASTWTMMAQLTLITTPARITSGTRTGVAITMTTTSPPTQCAAPVAPASSAQHRRSAWRRRVGRRVGTTAGGAGRT